MLLKTDTALDVNLIDAPSSTKDSTYQCDYEFHESDKQQHASMALRLTWSLTIFWIGQCSQPRYSQGHM
jgi:hypothetical protein